MGKPELTNEEANETLAWLQDEEMERANEVLDEIEREEVQLQMAEEPAVVPPLRRDPVFKNEKGPMTLGSIDRK